MAGGTVATLPPPEPPPPSPKRPAAVEAAAVAAEATVARSAVVAVTLLQHRRRAFFERIDAERHEAEDVFVDAHLALHLGDRGRRRVDVEQREVGLAVLAIR